MIRAIVCCDKAFGIGKDNKLLFNLKSDMKFFKETTLNNVVVFGYNTLLSLPNSKPLSNRHNIVICPNEIDHIDNCEVFHDLDSLMKHLKKLSDEGNNVFICGGAMLYKTTLDYIDEALVTIVDYIDRDATVFFPNLDNDPNFIRSHESDTFNECNLSFKFTTYKRI